MTFRPTLTECTYPASCSSSSEGELDSSAPHAKTQAANIDRTSAANSSLGWQASASPRRLRAKYLSTPRHLPRVSTAELRPNAQELPGASLEHYQYCSSCSPGHYVISPVTQTFSNTEHPPSPKELVQNISKSLVTVLEAKSMPETQADRDFVSTKHHLLPDETEHVATDMVTMTRTSSGPNSGARSPRADSHNAQKPSDYATADPVLGAFNETDPSPEANSLLTQLGKLSLEDKDAATSKSKLSQRQQRGQEILQDCADAGGEPHNGRTSHNKNHSGGSRSTNTSGGAHKRDRLGHGSPNEASSGDGLPEDDEDDESHKRKKGKQRQACASPKDSLLCPFYVANPVKHSQCARYDLADVSAVKQHLKRVHKRPEFYCSRCFQHFEFHSEEKSHTRSNHCEIVSEPQNFQDLMTEDDWYKVSRKHRYGYDESAWFEIYKILFNTRPPLKTPYRTAAEAQPLHHISSILRNLPGHCLAHLASSQGLPWDTQAFVRHAHGLIMSERDVQVSPPLTSVQGVETPQLDQGLLYKRTSMLPHVNQHEWTQAQDLATNRLSGTSSLDSESGSGKRIEETSTELALPGFEPSADLDFASWDMNSCTIDTSLGNCTQVSPEDVFPMSGIRTSPHSTCRGNSNQPPLCYSQQTPYLPAVFDTTQHQLSLDCASAFNQSGTSAPFDRYSTHAGLDVSWSWPSVVPASPIGFE